MKRTFWSLALVLVLAGQAGAAHPDTKFAHDAQCARCRYDRWGLVDPAPYSLHEVKPPPLPLQGWQERMTWEFLRWMPERRWVWARPRTSHNPWEIIDV